MVLLNAHLDRVKAHWIDGTADLVVEFVPAESVTTDRVRKLREYEAAGVPEYILIDARDGHDDFAYHRLDDHGRYAPVTPDAMGRFYSAVLPGFWLDPAWFALDGSSNAADLLLAIAPEAYSAWFASKRRATGKNDSE